MSPFFEGLKELIRDAVFGVPSSKERNLRSVFLSLLRVLNGRYLSIHKRNEVNEMQNKYVFLSQPKVKKNVLYCLLSDLNR